VTGWEGDNIIQRLASATLEGRPKFLSLLEIEGGKIRASCSSRPHSSGDTQTYDVDLEIDTVTRQVTRVSLEGSTCEVGSK
jgi:hypothetical protein